MVRYSMQFRKAFIIAAAAVTVIGLSPMAALASQETAPATQAPAANLETVDLVVSGMV
jgi:hypothetical protein